MTTWVPPPPGEQFPPMRTADLLVTAKAVEAFVVARGGSIPPGSALERWVRTLATATGQSVSGNADPRVDALAALGDVYGACLLAWSARVLQSAPVDAVTIDRSLITNEVMNQDAQPIVPVDRARVMPGGVGALYVAALLQHVGGGRVDVAGCRQPQQGVRKPDLQWYPPGGGHVTFERKDRAFFRSAEEDADSLAKEMLTRSLSAASQMRGPNSIPVAVIGAVTHHDVAVGAAELIGNTLQDAWRAETDPPAGVYLHFHGLSVEGGTVRARLVRHFHSNEAHPCWTDPGRYAAAQALHNVLV